MLPGDREVLEGDQLTLSRSRHRVQNATLGPLTKKITNFFPKSAQIMRWSTVPEVYNPQGPREL